MGKVIAMEKIRFKDYLVDYLEFDHITNKEFARRIDITEQHLNGILLKDRDLSVPIILAISLVTDIPVNYIYNIESNYRLEKDIISYLKKFNLTETEYLKKYDYKYLIKTGYLEFTDTSDKIEIIKGILKFLRVPTPENVGKTDEQIYYKSKNNKPELLLLWLEKCYCKTLVQIVTKYQKENIDILIDYIKKQAQKGIFDEKNSSKV